MEKSERINIRLEPNLKHMALEKVKTRRTTLSQVLRKALRQWVLGD